MKIIAYILLFCGLTMAANAAGYGVVDFEYVANESMAQKSATKQIQDYEKSLRAGFEKEIEQIRKIEGEITTSKDKLNEKQLKDKEADYNKKVADFQKRAQEKQESIQQSATEVSTKIEKALKEAVMAVAKAKSLDVVYASGALAYFDEKNNVSKDVLDELNKKLSKITVRKP